ncbi:MAG TPA: 30S ribosome-binding factor RbfA [Planctomycetaceae bacterium]|nr:30S ribosome-binding factor RbfA [Planctomycetaceae bacterium]
MTTRRMAKASEAIRETVSTTILFELKDPRVKNVTVLRAEAAGDLKTAKVYISVMGDAKKQSLCMHGLESARGFIQSKLADRLQTKYTPILKFILDPGVKLSAITSQLLKETGTPSESAADDTQDQNEEDSDEDNDDAMTAAEEEAGAQDGP